MALAARLLLAAVLAYAAVAKLANPPKSPAGWPLLVLAEGGLAVAVALGSDSAAYAAAAILLVMALVVVSALMRGRAGEPCGCFGPDSRISWWAVVRNAALAAAFALLPALG